MSNAYFLSALISGMSLLLLPAQAPRNAQGKQPVQSAPQEVSRAVHVDIDRDEPDMDMDVDVEIPEVQIDIDEPQIEMDADFDHEDFGGDVIDHDDGSLAEHEQEKIEKSFAMPAGPGRRMLEIDNVWGSIEVVGTASDQVQLTVNKSIRAESRGKIEQA